MSTPQPIDDKDRASLDGLEGVFTEDEKTSKKEDSKVQEPDKDQSDENAVDEAEDLEEEQEEEQQQEEQQQDLEDDEDSEQEDLDDRDEESNQIVDSERSADPADSEEKAGTSLAKSFVDGEDRVARQDLINLLEGFVGILKKDGDTGFALGKTQQPEELKFTDVDVEDKTVELEDMRRLMIEAQETIIKLLTDRVEDRARIATLETELKLLPDLQEQADRAMAVAFKTEEFRTELHKVKYELEKSRIDSVRRNMYKGPKGLLTKVQRWLIKAKGRSQLQFNENHAQERIRPKKSGS